jgi:hypothetical protein
MVYVITVGITDRLKSNQSRCFRSSPLKLNPMSPVIHWLFLLKCLSSTVSKSIDSYWEERITSPIFAVSINSTDHLLSLLCLSLYLYCCPNLPGNPTKSCLHLSSSHCGQTSPDSYISIVLGLQHFLNAKNDFLFLSFFKISFIHMCIQCLDYFCPPLPALSLSPAPFLPPPTAIPYQAETILPLSLILLKREYKQ